MDVEKLGDLESGRLFTQVLLSVHSPWPGVVPSAGDSAVNRDDSDLPSKVGPDAPGLWSVLLPGRAAPPG